MGQCRDIFVWTRTRGSGGRGAPGKKNIAMVTDDAGMLRRRRSESGL